MVRSNNIIYKRSASMRALFSIIVASIAVVGTVPASVAQVPQPPVVKVEGLRQIAPHVYIIPDNSVPAVPNVGIVVGDRAALVIDTGMGRANGAAVYEVAQKLAGTKPLYLVTTHVHPEHDLGAQGFPATTTLIRSTGQLKDITEFGLQLAKVFAAVQRSTPNSSRMRSSATPTSYSNRLTSLISGVSRRSLSRWAPTTQLGDTAIWFDTDRVLFTGDIAMWPQPVFASPYSSHRHWLTSLDRLEALRPSMIVPSHGPTDDTSVFITNYRTYLVEVRDRTEAEKRAGRTLDQTVEIVIAAFGDRAPDKARLTGAIKAAYAEVP